MVEGESQAGGRRNADPKLDGVPGLIWASDEMGDRVYLNPGWLDFTGLPAEKQLDDGWMSSIHPDDLESYLAVYRRCLAERSSGQAEFRLRRSDGQYRWILEQLRPRTDEDEAWAGLVATGLDISEQRHVRETAQEAEGELQAILDSAMDAIISIDESHRISLFNRGAERVFRCAASEALGRTIGDFLPVELREQHDEHIRDFGRSGVKERQMSPREVRGRRSDGDEFPAEARISQAELSGRKVFTVILRDITDRKRAEALSVLADTTAVLSRSLDYETTLDAISRTFLRHFADWCTVHLVRPDGHVERAMAVHRDPEKERFAAQFLREGVDLSPVHTVVASGKPILVREIQDEMLAQFNLPEDRRQLLRDLSLRSAIIVPLAGRQRRIGTVSFVTAESRRRYQEADVEIAMEFGRRAGIALENALLYQETERERAQFMAIVASVDYAVCQLDAFGYIAHLNPGAEEILGRSSAQLQNTRLHDLVHRAGQDPSTCRGADCPILQVFRTGTSTSGDDNFITADGIVIPVRVHCSPIEVASTVIGAVVAFEDIKERLEADQRKDDFLAFASHELRNPLTPILGMSRWLERHVQQAPDKYEEGVAEAIDTLATEAERMANIVDVFLDLSRIESNRLVLDEGPVELRHVLENESAAVGRRYGDAKITLDLPEGGCILISDELRLRQVLSNLLDNAGKYGGDPPDIAVTLECDDEQATIRIRDQGPGIPEEDQALIFERFHRSSAVAGKQGFGVGLFLTREIVRQLDGSISFTSQAGVGTEFVVALPRRMPMVEDAE